MLCTVACMYICTVATRCNRCSTFASVNSVFPSILYLMLHCCPFYYKTINKSEMTHSWYKHRSALRESTYLDKKRRGPFFDNCTYYCNASYLIDKIDNCIRINHFFLLKLKYLYLFKVEISLLLFLCRIFHYAQYKTKCIAISRSRCKCRPYHSVCHWSQWHVNYTIVNYIYQLLLSSNDREVNANSKHLDKSSWRFPL